MKITEPTHSRNSALRSVLLNEVSPTAKYTGRRLVLPSYPAPDPPSYPAPEFIPCPIQAILRLLAPPKGQPVPGHKC